MRTSALIPLLPLLVAGIATAHPHPHNHHGLQQTQRKSLSHGPTHPHKTFEAVEHEFSIAQEYNGDWKSVVKAFLGDKVGEGWYIRDDSYTDSRTGLTHVYVRQLIHGLEVSDGDINLNIDSTGRVISWGSSFHPHTTEQPTPFTRSEGMANAAACESIAAAGIEAKQSISESMPVTSGPWGLVKSAAKAAFGLGGDEQAEVSDEVVHARNQLRKAEYHYSALCQTPLAGDEILTPTQALAHLLPRLQTSENLVPISADDLESHPEHTFAPKPATAEPPTEKITGKGLGMSGVVNPVPARLMYTQVDAGVPRMVWKFEIEMKENWYEAYVDVYSGELVRIVDWANDVSWGSSERDGLKGGGKQKPLPSPSKKYKPYSYNVFPWGINDPSIGNTSIEVKPWDTTASPLGWHEIPTSANPWPELKGSNSTKNATTFYTTAGNNVIAHEDWEGQSNYIHNYRPINESMAFVYDYEEPLGLAPKEYVDFVVTQLFYTSNMYHDLLHRVGFDEQSGNFQAYNFGKGGKGGDPVITNAQDGSGFNNANFMTPPDGTMPRMRMYVWDVATPWRDGDLEAGIVIHEYSHGLSTRLTGGPANSGCLGFGEAGGMGEGWGDAIATLIRQIEEHHQFKNGSDVYTMGSWAANNVRGIRNFPYSTNSTINPSSYKTLDKPGYWGVHAIGEVWAQFLFTMSQNLVEEYGFSKTLFPPTNTSEPNDYYTTVSDVDSAKPTPLIPKHGNTLALQLIVDGMKLQPCRPSFFDARDAIIQADKIRTGGVNACTIWKAFASVGLGSDARVIGQTPWGGGVRTDGHQFPSGVCKKHKA